VLQLQGFWIQGRFFLVALDMVILAVTIWVSIEALRALRTARNSPVEEDSDERAVTV
jgi:hypothetical protein